MPTYKVTSPIPPIHYDLGGIPVTTFRDAEVEEIKEESEGKIVINPPPCSKCTKYTTEGGRETCREYAGCKNYTEYLRSFL